MHSIRIVQQRWTCANRERAERSNTDCRAADAWSLAESCVRLFTGTRHIVVGRGTLLRSLFVTQSWRRIPDTWRRRVFERYTERARRGLFYARYEASAIGGRAIDPEHILLGLLRESQGVTSEIFARSGIVVSTVRQAIESSISPRDRLPTSVELPFTVETQHILQSAAREADLLGHNHVGSEHLLLGFLCGPQSLARLLLEEHGMDFDMVRNEIIQLSSEDDV